VIFELVGISTNLQLVPFTAFHFCAQMYIWRPQMYIWGQKWTS